MNDAEKLLKLAEWFDVFDAKTGYEDTEVQDDLRRIAERLGGLESMIESMKCCKTCRHCVDDSCAIYKSAQCFLRGYSDWEMMK